MKKGLEPLTLGLWFQCSNQLNYFILFQLHVPVQLPCYDFIQIINFSMVFHKLKNEILALWLKTSNKTNFLHVTGGVYKAEIHIHRDILIRDY